MKSILTLILSMVLLAFVGQVIAGEWGYFAKDQEELYGTWVNMKYVGIIPQKIIYKPVGTFNCFKKVNSNSGIQDSNQYFSLNLYYK